MESRPFARAFEDEMRVPVREMDQALADPDYFSRRHPLPYLHRGLYAYQLERWCSYFSPDRFLILESEAFFKNPAATLQVIAHFLGVQVRMPPAFRVYSSQTSPDPTTTAVRIPPKLHSALLEYFADSNTRLTQVIGFTPSWAGQDKTPHRYSSDFRDGTP
jgi:hypothetical protein